MRGLRRKWITITVVLLAVAGLASVTMLYLSRGSRPTVAERRALPPEAPPDLAKLQGSYGAGIGALRRGDAAAAARILSSFTFGGRAVEAYRLYLLGKACEASGASADARLALARFRALRSRAVVADDAGTRLAARYAAAGDWRNTSTVEAALASSTAAPATAAGARWGEIEARFAAGDAAGMLDAARKISIRSPRAPQNGAAASIQTSILALASGAPLPMTFAERLERAVGLLRDGDPATALNELNALEPATPASLRDAVALNRGLALNQLHRYEDSNKVLERLTSGTYRVAIPALYTAAKNYRTLSNSINPMVNKTITVRQRVGTTKVRRGKGKKAKIVSKPKYANVKKTIQLVDLAKKAKKDEWDRLASERLRDLLQLKQTAPSVRLEVLNTVIAVAEAKHQDDYEQELVSEAVKIDPYADPGLQHFWDKGWAAYLRGDLAGAKSLFAFIRDTYGNPNVKRQAEYWYARTIARAGDKAGSSAIYARLAAAPYEDVYALYSESHGAPRKPVTTNPTVVNRPDWRDIAEKNMPPELRLAYELTSLADFTDAAPEIERNGSLANQPFADALRAEKLDSDGNFVEMYRVLRRAFPRLATVEQDSVPPYFLKMYYPVKYENAIRKNADKQGVDRFLVMALILQESYFDPRARSRVGAIGLMQIMPATGKELGQQLHPMFRVSRLDNPETNIEIGTFHLKHLLSLFNGNSQLVAASYNAGQGNVLKWKRASPGKPMDEFLESIPFPETRNYVKRVTILRSAYSRIAQ